MESKLENLVKEVELEIRDQIAEIDERCMRNSLRALNAFQKKRSRAAGPFTYLFIFFLNLHVIINSVPYLSDF